MLPPDEGEKFLLNNHEFMPFGAISTRAMADISVITPSTTSDQRAAPSATRASSGSNLLASKLLFNSFLEQSSQGCAIACNVGTNRWQLAMFDNACLSLAVPKSNGSSQGPVLASISCRSNLHHEDIF